MKRRLCASRHDAGAGIPRAPDAPRRRRNDNDVDSSPSAQNDGGDEGI